MKFSDKTAYGALSVVFLALAGVAVWLGWTELRPFVELGGTQEERLNILRQFPPKAGFSTFSQNMVLGECLSALRSTEGRLLPEQDRKEVAENCRSAATAILDHAPGQGFAAYIAAHDSAILGENDKANAFLALSWRLAPNELWLAMNRLQFYRELGGIFDDASVKGTERDIALLSKMHEGADWLADWFISQDTNYQMIERVLETMPEDAQSSFVAAVKRLRREESNPQPAT